MKIKVKPVDGAKIPVVEGNKIIAGRYIGFERDGETLSEESTEVEHNSMVQRAIDRGNLVVVTEPVATVAKTPKVEREKIK